MQELRDNKKNGKFRDWRGKKIGSLNLAESYARLGMDNKAYRAKQCASFLNFVPDGDGMKFHSAYFCQMPLCPMCAMRRSMKIFGQVSRIMQYITEHDNYRYIFLTLTMRNVSGDDLSGAMDKLLHAYHAMTKRVKFSRLSKGWFRALEITHNWQRDDYHPHLHVIVAVDPRYFTHYENYLKHDEWKKEWQKCLGVDYDPWVYVRNVQKDKTDAACAASNEIKTISYGKAVAEVSKYATKSTDYLVLWRDRNTFERKTGIKLRNQEQCHELTDNIVAVLDDALHRRRLVAFGGRLKEVHKLLNLDDPIDGDLVNTDNDDTLREDLSAVIIRYNWHIGVGNYVLVDPGDFTFRRTIIEQKKQN